MRILVQLTWVELKLLAREPFAILFTLVFPLIVLVIISGAFSIEDAVDFRNTAPWDYYLATYIGVVIGAVGLISLPIHLASYIENGVLRRFRASSIPVRSVLLAHLIVGVLVAIVSSIVLVIAARLLYDAGMPDNVAGVVLGFVVGTVSFLTLGLLIAVITRNARAAQAVGMMLFFPMWLLSGAGPPPAVMNDAMKAVSDVLPLTFVVRAVQDPWIGAGNDTTSLLLLAALLAITGAVTVGLATQGD